MDVHAETIAAAIAEPDGEVRSLGKIPNRRDSVRKLLKKLGPVEKLRVCYEAGPTGYVLYWQLAELSVQCEVIAPSLVPVKAGDRVKTDRRDAEKLARSYRADLAVSSVMRPTEKDSFRSADDRVCPAQGDLAAIRLSSALGFNLPPASEGVLESSLYVNDVAGSARFYEKIFGFRTISDFGERGCAMQAGNRQVLLLFKKGGSPLIQSPDDGDGELHVAFAIPGFELSSWEAWLAENGIVVEEKRTWELGGHSVYFRDPDRHLIEIANPVSGRFIDVVAAPPQTA